jgi:ADP-ribose pyrophosphatase
MKLRPDIWKRERSEQTADCRVFKVRKDFSVRDSDKKEATFFVIEGPDWVNVVPLTPDRQVVLINQFRHGVEGLTLEIPGGLVDGSENHAVAAARELLEETGYAPREMIPLGRSRPNPAIQNNWIYHFLALDCEPEQAVSFDEHESITVKLAPLSEIPDLIQNELITHSLVIAAFHKFFLHYENRTS